MTLTFQPPSVQLTDARHHAAAAAANLAAAQRGLEALHDALSGTTTTEKVLLRAAAGAGKSYALVRMVQDALSHPQCARVAVTAFANKQVFPLAGDLGKALGPDKVCLFMSAAKLPDVADSVRDNVTIAHTERDIPLTATVVLGTSHKLGMMGMRSKLLAHLGEGANGESPFDVLLVDEAWQLPLHRYDTVHKLAPVTVGVGDVGQLPPLDPGQNPWRGDPGYNPYRAWPTAFEAESTTCAIDLPAVWRPTAAQLPLWRAFYSEWDRLDCVAAPGDRSVELSGLSGDAQSVWVQVATGVPTLLELEGLADPEAADVDAPLLQVLEDLLDPLLAGGLTLVAKEYDGTGSPAGEKRVDCTQTPGDPLIVVLATRNQAVDDAQAVVDRLVDKHGLPENVLIASTVDSWQGQTNGITVALHPLSGAEALDDFNSAFGRLAVTCTRATHGLLLLARAGLDDLLADAPARPGTPLGEPGARTLPRQTHQRILGCFARGELE